MIEYLRIRGLVLVDDVSLDLHPGMNVLTGETGAGKSIIVDAMLLIRGARGRADLVRDGESLARIEAQFAVGEGPGEPGQWAGVLARHGLDRGESGDGTLVVERVVGRAGRGRCVVQGALTTRAVLAELGERLIDICSQHEHHSLTRLGRHLELLDDYADHHALLRAYAEQFEALEDVRASQEAMHARAAQAGARADYLRFQIDELERVAPQPGEHEGLTARVQLMRDAHRWQAFAHEARQVLYEADDAVAGRLSALLDAARRRAAPSELLEQLEDQLETARIACEEAADAAARLRDEVELEPEALELAQERLHELERLRRKHGCGAEELATRLLAMQQELDELQDLEHHRAAIDDRERELSAACRVLALELRAGRQRAARRLMDAVERELAALHMAAARLEARVEAVPDERLGPRGIDRVEFSFSANPGEPVAPLARVASGGELSRVLLAIKGVLATGDQVATYVFDEVDAGVGGAVAQAIGRRLALAARQRQVLCITHLPQIAAFADAHHRVEKRSAGGRTVTRVVTLDEHERLEELARMLGGSRVTESAREHARELLAQARGDDGRRERRAPRPRPGA